MTAVHPVRPEDLMAYLDGETTAPVARDIQAHLADCDACQRLAAELRDGSQQMREWQLEEPPALAAPPFPTRAQRPVSFHAQVVRLFAQHRLVAATAIVVLLVGTAIVSQPVRKAPIRAAASTEKAESLVPDIEFQSRLAGNPSFNAGRALAAAQGIDGGRSSEPGIVAGPRIVRTATLRLVAVEFDRIRPEVDRILKGVGGFVGGLTNSDRPGSPRSLRGTLRIPSAQFDSALAALRALGRVTEESQGADDVTATVVDLEVRLANSRVTEKRLSELLRNRTGGVSDVLEVEREMARVRTEIEQMDAERKQFARRIEYATLTLEVVEERAAAVNLGPVPVPERLRHAIADGVESAAMSMLEAALFALRAGPALVLWTIVLGLPTWLLVRRYAARLHRPGGV
jgi:hypothetical protein